MHTNASCLCFYLPYIIIIALPSEWEGLSVALGQGVHLIGIEHSGLKSIEIFTVGTNGEQLRNVEKNGFYTV